MQDKYKTTAPTSVDQLWANIQDLPPASQGEQDFSPADFQDCAESSPAAGTENLQSCETAETDGDSAAPNDLPAANEVTWTALGFSPGDATDGFVQGTIPEGFCLLAAKAPELNQPFGRVCMEITNDRPYSFERKGLRHYLYALEEGFTVPEAASLPETVDLMVAGSSVFLPEGAPQELPTLGEAEFAILAALALDPVIADNPLMSFSLRGQAEEFEKQAVAAKPLLGKLCLTGQASAWYAPPNAGKTLIMLKLLIDAIAEKRITPGNVYYINADDGSEGFATKIRLMDDMGCHTLAPGHRGFIPTMLPDLLNTMAESKKARGALIIIDTIKKAASLMDKGKASTFTSACRRAVMAGATIVGFAHTNKATQANGKLQYGGTTDLRDDFDAAYVAGPIEIDGFEGDKVVQFECIKSRGGNARLAAYAYADSEDLSYAERLASVRLLDDSELEGFRRDEAIKADAVVIEAIEECIRTGDYAKMALAKAAAKRAGVSERAAIRMIEKYTGTNPDTARWHFQRKERGAMIYTLLATPSEEPAGD